MFFAPFVLSAAALVPAPAQGTHPFTVHDMLAMQRLSDPQVSPDGLWVLFALRTTDVEANKGRTDLWLCGADGSNLRRVTQHEGNESNARWMPDGKSFVYLATRSGSSQVWRQSIEDESDAKAEQLTKLPVDVDNLVVFPDGKRLLLTMEVYPELTGDAALQETARRDAEKDAKKVKAKVYESLFFRHWDTWEDGKRSHVFAWEIGGGAPLDLMPGLDADAPTKPFGGGEELSISPDGNEVAFAAQRMTRDAAWSTDVNVWTVPSKGGVPPKNVTADNLATDTQPSYSPDGKTLAWLAMARPGYESDRLRIVLQDRASGAKRVLADAWDRSAGGITWSKDAKTIWTTADHFGNKALFAIDVAGGKVKTLVERGTNDAPRELAGGRVLFLQDSLKSPAELYSVGPEGGMPKTVTAINKDRVALARMGDYEPFQFPGWNRETVYGFAMRPADFTPGRKYPVAFLIHGGPQGSFGDHFHYRWNPQAYAGAGFAVVFIDFHGSTGYGQAFTDSIRGDWGGKPYEDLMKGLDYALGKYEWMDGARMAALGASYGGYMINWLHGQTDRFKALVCHDGNLDERMAYFDTEELWFPEWEHGGTPWENEAGYVKHNPIDHIAKWTTPTLVVHSANDFRVVDTQGMSTFTALQRRGVPSKLLWFPDENHWVLKPQNSILWHETVLDWIDRWCRSAAGETVPASSGR
ncbi:MAG: S9 family peptidase [Planctomycetota bacterium]